MPQFAATIKHIEEGLKGFTISAGVKNIEGWEETLGKLDNPDAKPLLRDLEKLKTLLHADTVDGGAVKALVMKLGHETVALATKAGGDTTNKADAKTAEQIKRLGEALEGAARA